MNIQGALIDENELVEFTEPKIDKEYDLKIGIVIDYLKNAKRPLIVAGH
jgi:thiamine pyrophosphate-dependent acetolactate synthase large subunit-like protein